MQAGQQVPVDYSSLFKYLVQRYETGSNYTSHTLFNPSNRQKKYISYHSNSKDKHVQDKGVIISTSAITGHTGHGGSSRNIQ